MSKPVAVLISDIHYNINTLPLADATLRQAVNKANEYVIPLIVAGDLHDTKANMRAECVNAMLETFKLLKSRDAYIIRGNHDAINEKSAEHSLNFLRKYAYIVDFPRHLNFGLNHYDASFEAYLMPYHHNVEELRSELKTIPSGSTIIMHQGIQGSKSGDYIQDKSALTTEDLAGHRVISGHYHTRQTIDLPNGGKFDYIGNPFTLGFAESNDPPKGFQILMEDGSLEFIPTNLRKHVIVELEAWTVNRPNRIGTLNVDDKDLLWLKIKGTKEELHRLTRDTVSKVCGLKQDYKLEFIPSDIETNQNETNKSLNSSELLDSLIDSMSNTSDNRKQRLKSLWRGM